MTRKLLILIISIICITGLFSFSPANNDCHLRIEKVRITNDEKQTNCIISVTLTNNSNDTLKYFSMSCSYDFLYTIDNNALKIRGSNCDKNVPVILVLLPNESRKEILNIIIPQKMDSSGIKFKIGFNLILVTNESLNQDIDFWLKRDLENYIWSNEITLGDL